MRAMRLSRTLAVLAALAATSPLAACGDDDPADDSPGAEASGSPAGGAPAAEGACEYVEDPQGAAKEVDLPSAEPAYSGEVAATIATSVGDLSLTLDADAAPCTVNSFASLAEQGYYDGSDCHRLADFPGFQMLQCGDPTATGTGGPGYTIPDEVTGEETYAAGTVAMANTGQPNSGGGQFFLVYGDTQLDPAYTVFGTFDQASIDLLKGVAEKGHDQANPDGTGFPNEKVTFESVTIG
jgi:peptidyl-prolyl cis-trans isomerase B (cyclophilin B)